MESKKLIIKRIVIFSILAVVPVIIIAAIASDGFKNPIYDDIATNQIAIALTGGFAMLAPALAVLLTRFITKEGFKDSYLAHNFKDNAKYYIASVLVPLFNSILGMILMWLFLLNDKAFSDVFTLKYIGEIIPFLLLQLATSLIVIPHTFGEEWGWRGYLMPKLLKIMNKSAAIIVGGIIWGLWHAPFTIIGHNFTTKIPGFPFSGIALMCLFCIVANVMMTFITERTKSIYPTCFIHGITNNMGVSLFFSAFLKEEIAPEVAEIKSYEAFAPMICSMLLPAIVCMILFLKKDKKAE